MQITRLINSEKLQDILNALYHTNNIPLKVIGTEGEVICETPGNVICFLGEVESESQEDVCKNHFEKYSQQGTPCKEQIQKCPLGLCYLKLPIQFDSQTEEASLIAGLFREKDTSIASEAIQRMSLEKGIDSDEILAEMNRIPVLKSSEVSQTLAFYRKFIELIAELAHKNQTLNNEIESQREVREKLEKSEKRYRRIFNNIRDVYFEVTIDGKIIEISPSIDILSDYSREELIGQDMSTYYSNPDDRMKMLTQLQKTGEIVDYEIEFVNRDGSRIPCSITARIAQGEDGSPNRVCGTLRNITTRKQSEQELWESEQRFRKLFETTGDAVLLLRDGKIISLNQAAVKLFDFDSESDAIGVRPLDLSPENQPDGLFSKEKAQTLIQTVVENGHCYFEWQHRTSKGRVFLAEIQLNAVKLNDNYLIQVVARDISERKRQEVQLRNSEERFRIITEEAGLMIYDQDVVARRMEWSGAIEKVTGYLPSEFQLNVNALMDLIHPDDRESAFTHVEDAKFLPGNQLLEYRIKSKDGTYRHIRDSGIILKDQDGNIVRMLGVLVDVTERKQEQEALREREQMFRAISTSALDAVIMVNERGEAVFWNPAAEKMFGFSREEILGKNLHKLIVPDRFKAEARQGFEKYQRLGSGPVIGLVIELAALRKSREEFPIEISVSGINHNDQFWAVALIRDITERKKAELKLKQAKEETDQINRQLEESIKKANQLAREADRANASKSEFLANMSHEIRTPMNGVIGMIDILLETELTQEQRDFAETVSKSADSLLTILNDILDFSKIEAGKMDLDIIEFNLFNMIDSMNDILAVRAQDKNLEYICSIDPDIPDRVKGDPGRLRQILTNLIGNAVKFTTNGEIVIDVKLVQESPSDILLKFSVSDTGIGIAEEKINSLFQAFVQADASTTRKFGGTGLGLSICRSLIRMMGGKIGVSSVVGKGSRFWFTVMLTKVMNRSTSDIIPVISIRNRKILIVDDNETNRKVLSRQLESWGCIYSAVDSAETALKMLLDANNTGDPFELAILDMQMPDIDGEELGRTIKNHLDIQQTILVMLTSVGMRGDASRMRKIGFDAYLTKPVKHNKLLDCLRTLFGQGSISTGMEKTSLVTWHTLKESDRGKERILLAEDNKINQKVAVKLLENLGYQVDVVDNGLEAIEALKTVSYSLILMDVQMPEMDGFEATRHIRNAKSDVIDHDIPVIALTAHAIKGDREKCLEAGMNDYVSKPINKKQLANVLDRQLKAKHLSEAESSQESEQSNEDVFDRKAFMERLFDDEELCAEILQMYTDDIPEQLKKLKEAVSQGDAFAFCSIAHTIKGASANIEARTMKEVSFKLEKAGKAEDLTNGMELIQELSDEFQRFLKAI